MIDNKFDEYNNMNNVIFLFRFMKNLCLVGNTMNMLQTIITYELFVTQIKLGFISIFNIQNNKTLLIVILCI